MSTHPLIRIERQRRDFRDPTLYAECLEEFPDATTLPPFSYEAKGFVEFEDEQVWTRSWVFVGTADSVPSKGDLLSYTVGRHGIHLQRNADATFAARFNHAQHGGCRFVPLQCQTGKKTRCSYTSCGHSRDRDVIQAANGEEPPEMRQYLGGDPSKLQAVPHDRVGPFLFVNLAPDPAELHSEAAELFAWSQRRNLSDANCLTPLALDIQCNWKLLGRALTGKLQADRVAAGSLLGEASDTPDVLIWSMPNLVVHDAFDSVLAFRLQPTGPTDVTVTCYIYRMDSRANEEVIRDRAALRILEAVKAARSWQKQWTAPGASKVLETNAEAHRFQMAFLKRLLATTEFHFSRPIYSALGRALNAGVNA